MKNRETGLALGPLVHRVLERHPAFTANPIGEWRELVGEALAHHSQPKSLRNAVLTIVAYDSVWKHHLELNKEALIEKINRNRREPLVEKITIRIGEVPASTAVLNPNYRLLEKAGAKSYPSRKKKKPPLRPLSPEEKALLKSLPDPELRTIGARLLRRIPLDEPVGNSTDGEA